MKYVIDLGDNETEAWVLVTGGVRECRSLGCAFGCAAAYSCNSLLKGSLPPKRVSELPDDLGLCIEIQIWEFRLQEFGLLACVPGCGCLTFGASRDSKRSGLLCVALAVRR